jgi:ketosteroid isomerase-like protein
MTGNAAPAESDNVRLVRDAYDAFATGRLADVVGSFAPNIEWRLAEHHPYAPASGRWTTPDDVARGLFDRVALEWQDFRCVPTRISDAGDRVVVEGRYRARYLPTGLDEDAEFCHLWTLHDGRITSFQQYVDTAQVRAVMGAPPTPLLPSRPVFDDPDGIDATWRHLDARDGFEIASLRSLGDGHRLTGHTSAVEDGTAWSVGYVIDVDAHWRTVRADLTELSAGRHTTMTIESDRAGHWLVDGTPAPSVAGCIDIDLESSALTNTIFLHRTRPTSPHPHHAPAAFVRCAPLRVERVDQTYRPTGPDRSTITYRYRSPAYDTDIELHFDRHGLVLDYPGLATRHA